MAARDARQHRPRQRGLAIDRLARRDDRERARRRDAEGLHGLAEDILPQDRSEPGPPVAPAREGRAARALELDVEALARRVQDLAEEDRPTVAELRHEVAELVAGIGHGQRVRAVGHPVAREHSHAVRRP